MGKEERRGRGREEITTRRGALPREGVRDLGQKDSVWGETAGWGMGGAEVGVGGDHPYHMFHGVLQCGRRWWAEHARHA